MRMDELRVFFEQWKGKPVVARFTILESEPSKALKGYYYNYVVPTMQQTLWQAGDRRTEEDTDKFLRMLSPVCCEQTHNGICYDTRIKAINELSDAELSEHVEIVRQLAAEEYGIYIQEPK